MSSGSPKTLDDLERTGSATLVSVGGTRSFRRRLMELGLLPGTTVTVLNVAPFGDPLEIEARGCRLSIRRHEAATLAVRG